MASQKQREKKRAAETKVERVKAEEAGRVEASAPSFFESLTEGKLLFFVVASAVLVYANSLSGEFLFDDTKQIVGNPTLDSWGNIWRAFVGAVWDFQRDTGTNEIPPPYYRPFFTVYLILGYKLFGLWPAGWHLLSVAAHAGATALVYFFLKRLSGSRAVSATAALMFGLHPTHTESVSWISGIPDPLMALFFLPALIWYERFRAGDGRRYFVWSVAAFAVAVFCKETALALPVFVAFREVFFGDGRFVERVRRTALRLVPYAAVSALYL
ncbi:MAG TPA: hypothetical protein VGV38_08215, partial [Pyrinomonadaceae bacterium]|nr:hypothetical protein [Pyrinomonadaceae bacterium]